MGSGETDAFFSWLQAQLTERLGESARLAVGRPVCQINDIHLSYADCLSRRTDAPCAQTPQPLPSAELKAQLLSFLQLHFANPDLSQTLVADQFGLSVYSLSRFFKNQIGVGFSEEHIAGMRLDSGPARAVDDRSLRRGNCRGGRTFPTPITFLDCLRRTSAFLLWPFAKTAKRAPPNPQGASIPPARPQGAPPAASTPAVCQYRVKAAPSHCSTVINSPRPSARIQAADLPGKAPAPCAHPH